MTEATKIRLTQFSHGAGCGCKIAPNVLEQILASAPSPSPDSRLLVGYHSRDDAAVYDLGSGQALISTTDFFMPIVDDPVAFGRIAAANAISDVYAMGGRPLLAIAILGWPVSKISADIAREVVEGGRQTCAQAGIPLAGGHSIDTPEPIFGLAVNGLVDRGQLKRNDTAQPGDSLLLTKPLGIGILTTAEKRGLLRPDDLAVAVELMTTLNSVGERLARLEAVHAMTDVTGFGLLGHLIELCEGSGVAAELNGASVPLAADLQPYLDQGCIPGGTQRNWASYGHQVGALDDYARNILSDPQTSGGLLIAVGPEGLDEAADILRDAGLTARVHPIGRLTPRIGRSPRIVVRGGVG